METHESLEAKKDVTPVPAKQRPTDDALIAQLSELNARSHEYSRRLWQLPLSFVGITVAMIGLVQNSTLLPWVSLLAGIVGGLLLIHMSGLHDGVDRAVDAIQETEEKLGFVPPTAEKHHRLILWPLHGLAILVVLACLLLFVLGIIGALDPSSARASMR